MEVTPQDPMTIEEGDEEGEDGEEADAAQEGTKGEGQPEGVGAEQDAAAPTPTATVETVAIDAMANGAHGALVCWC